MIEQIAEARPLVEDDDHRQRIFPPIGLFSVNPRDARILRDHCQSRTNYAQKSVSAR